MKHNQEQELRARRGDTKALLSVLNEFLTEAKVFSDYLGAENDEEFLPESPRHLAFTLHDNVHQMESIVSNFSASSSFNQMEGARKLLIMFELDEDEEGGGLLYREKDENLCNPQWFLVRDDIATRIFDIEEFCSKLGIPVPGTEPNEQGTDEHGEDFTYVRDPAIRMLLDRINSGEPLTLLQSDVDAAIGISNLPDNAREVLKNLITLFGDADSKERLARIEEAEGASHAKQ